MNKKLLFTLVSAFILAGCSQGTKMMTGNLVSTNIEENTINIKGFSFNPSESTASIGTKITVNNQDTVGHTITADNGAFDTKTVAAGTSFTFNAPENPGIYKFHCSSHPYMTGTLTVTGTPKASPTE